MQITMFRVVGNEIPPRHEVGQTIQNLKYQLDNEPEFEDCAKVWVLNRILDNDIQEHCMQLLEGRVVFTLKFNPDTYAQQKSFNDKFGYLTNNNGARNFCIDLGFSSFKSDIVLPFDGNCFFTLEGWLHFRNTVMNNFYSPYFIVPMARCAEYEDTLEQPMVRELYTVGRMVKQDLTEPQIAFGKDHDLRFNPDRRYSEAPKVDLLWRLGVPGIHDYFYSEPGGLREQAMRNPSKFIERQPVYAGYVFRLPSGNTTAEKCNVVRGAARQEGLRRLVEKADSLVSV